MSNSTKALIVTWVIIGFLIIGGVGFYLGRMTTQTARGQFSPSGMTQQQGGGMMPQGSSGMMQQGNQMMQQQFGQPTGGLPQQNPPSGGQQLPQQK